jgi:hypothetical protein
MSIQSSRALPQIPTAASRWTRRTLVLLNAYYDYTKVYSLLDDVKFPDLLQESIVAFGKCAKPSYQRNGRGSTSCQ